MASHGASTLGVVANAAAFAGGRAWLDGILTYLDGSRSLLAELLTARLPEVRYRPPDGTYLAWLDCRDLGLGDEPGAVFQDRAGVALVDGVRCGQPGHVRLNFATPRPILTEIVDRMASALGR